MLDPCVAHDGVRLNLAALGHAWIQHQEDT